MHPSTTAIITATEYTDGIFLQIHVQIFYGPLHPLECMPWILLFCIFGDFYASGIRDAEVNKDTAYFFGMDKRLLEDFVLKCNQRKYWMSFIDR